MGAIRLALVAVLTILVAACAPPKVPYDRPDTIKTIGVVTPRFPEGPIVFLASNVGQHFGLIGALIEAGMQADRETKFKAVLDQRSFSAQQTFLQSLTAELQSRGYAVTPITLARGTEDFATSYATEGAPKVDAYLDVVVANYGYVAAGIGKSTPYRPIFTIKTRLVSAKDAALLMQDNVIYNPIQPAMARQEIVTIAPDPAYVFVDFDSLMASPESAVKGLHVATEQTAQVVGKLLR
jgi:hypothetical protein